MIQQTDKPEVTCDFCKEIIIDCYFYKLTEIDIDELSLMSTDEKHICTDCLNKLDTTKLPFKE